MSSKRKFTSSGLERRVRARREEEWEPEAEPSSSDESEEQDASEGGEAEEGETGSDSGSEASEQDAGTEAEDHFSSISFGALARAQKSLPPTKRKGKAEQAAEDATSTRSTGEQQFSKRGSSKTQKQDLTRSSKHAPQEVTSKKPVSRRREIIADTRRKARDPRFDPLTGKVDEARMAKAYSFLDDYRESEMVDLRAQIKKTRDAGEKETLKRQLLSMESRKKARQKKDEEAKVLNEHRQKEKELVAQGKKPFYLKQSEQKKQLLVNRYANMSKGQVDKAIERKRKKVASKEKRELASLERIDRRH